MNLSIHPHHCHEEQFRTPKEAQDMAEESVGAGYHIEMVNFELFLLLEG